jgi:kinesin family protein 1
LDNFLLNLEIFFQYDGMCVLKVLSSTPPQAADIWTDGADKGIIPLTCLELFDRVLAKKAADPHVNFTVEVSYIEVS